MTEWERALGYQFTRQGLLREALTSGAFAADHPGEFLPNHGRLAFLGDAILYLIVTQEDLGRAPVQGPHDRVREKALTDARKARVENTNLARIARDHKLQLPTRTGQATDGGRGRTKQLATAVEAVIGAIYRDSKDLGKTAKIVLRFVPRSNHHPNAPG